MEVKIRNRNNNKGYVKCNLVLNSQGFYDMIVMGRVYNNQSNSLILRTSSCPPTELCDSPIDEGDSWEIPGWLCAVGCGASVFAMSLADGPAPVADAIAIGYAIQCGSEC